MSYATHFFCSLLFYEDDLKLEKEINICFIKDALFWLSLKGCLVAVFCSQQLLQAAQTLR